MLADEALLSTNFSPFNTFLSDPDLKKSYVVISVSKQITHVHRVQDEQPAQSFSDTILQD